ncbi:hypothetical protein PLESTF_001732000 [Pleodorina starrii]|nr:hypothetical protein PLESTF_001732000 [Pleodorina starrii]
MHQMNALRQRLPHRVAAFRGCHAKPRPARFARCCAQTQDIVESAVQPSHNYSPLDLLMARTPSGTTEPLQLTNIGGQDTLTALWKGKVLKLTAARGDDAQGSWTTEQIGSYPSDESELVKAFPQLRGRLLDDLHNHAGPPQPTFASLSNVYSLQHLQDDVTRDCALWCDGTRPGAPEKSPLQSLTLTAGELVSLMQGRRGVVIVQLWNGFERSRGQPIYDPWVIELLEAALRTPGVKAAASVAPGGVGLTAVMYADREPWNAWGPHLASFGCQANAVAGSPYYKLLIGKILGYKDENIHGYVRSVGGGLTPAVISQVDADLKKLSKAKPKLPWNKEGSRGKKAPAAPAPTTATAAAAAKGSAGAAPRRGGRK